MGIMEGIVNNKKRPLDISFHYTNPEMVNDLIQLIPFMLSDSVLDAGSGKNKVWYNHIPSYCDKNECDIEDGVDFFEMKKEFDWIIGNPPFHIGHKFFLKASELSVKGFAFLSNIQSFNSLTTKRLDEIKRNGFYIQRIHVVNDKRWFGRYFFIIFEKKINSFFTFNLKSY